MKIFWFQRGSRPLAATAERRLIWRVAKLEGEPQQANAPQVAPAEDPKVDENIKKIQQEYGPKLKNLTAEELYKMDEEIKQQKEKLKKYETEEGKSLKEQKAQDLIEPRDLLKPPDEPDPLIHPHELGRTMALGGAALPLAATASAGAMAGATTLAATPGLGGLAGAGLALAPPATLGWLGHTIGKKFNHPWLGATSGAALGTAVSAGSLSSLSTLAGANLAIAPPAALGLLGHTIGKKFNHPKIGAATGVAAGAALGFEAAKNTAVLAATSPAIATVAGAGIAGAAVGSAAYGAGRLNEKLWNTKSKNLLGTIRKGTLGLPLLPGYPLAKWREWAMRTEKADQQGAWKRTLKGAALSPFTVLGTGARAHEAAWGTDEDTINKRGFVGRMASGLLSPATVAYRYTLHPPIRSLAWNPVKGLYKGLLTKEAPSESNGALGGATFSVGRKARNIVKFFGYDIWQKDGQTSPAVS